MEGLLTSLSPPEASDIQLGNVNQSPFILRSQLRDPHSVQNYDKQNENRVTVFLK